MKTDAGRDKFFTPTVLVTCDRVVAGSKVLSLSPSEVAFTVLSLLESLSSAVFVVVVVYSDAASDGLAEWIEEAVVSISWFTAVLLLLADAVMELLSEVMLVSPMDSCVSWNAC